ncbi:MAG: hypothetical protein RLY97_1139 [Pseudomonadota bacterium]|jgi:hypothetical protein
MTGVSRDIFTLNHTKPVRPELVEGLFFLTSMEERTTLRQAQDML